ncbi:MAG: hypothetical protein QM817_28395 [Archangium sp.]
MNPILEPKESWRCQSLPAWRRQRATPHLHPRLVRSREVVNEACACIERSWQHGFRDTRFVDLRHVVRTLPLIVQCAVRVHDKREGQAMVLGLDLPGTSGRVERHTVLIARCQQCVLLFSPRGALDAAGNLCAGQVIDWDDKPHEHDWY